MESITVNIKESSIYYHFKNKQDILDSLVEKYESHVKELTDMLQASMLNLHNVSSFSWDWLREFYFEQYLFDTFCNQMMRFMMLTKFGIMNEEQAIKAGNDFFANISMLTFKYLLTGELTKAKKDAFDREVFAYINRKFQEE